MARIVVTLRSWRRRSPSPLLVRRATILLALRDGATYAQAAALARTSVSTVRKWRARFVAAYRARERGELRSELERLGLPEDQRERERKRALARKLLARGWTGRRVSEAVGLSEATISRLRRR